MQSYHLRNTLALRLSRVFAFLSWNLEHPFKRKALSEIQHSVGLPVWITAWLMHGWSGSCFVPFMLDLPLEFYHLKCILLTVQMSSAHVLRAASWIVNTWRQKCVCCDAALCRWVWLDWLHFPRMIRLYSLCKRKCKKIKPKSNFMMWSKGNHFCGMKLIYQMCSLYDLLKNFHL